jgi:hypothetical protein
MKSKSIAFGLLLTLLCAGESHATVPLGAGFTYQGRLNDNGAPANGNYDMIFNLYDAPTNGSVLGSFSIFGAVPVTNGLFNVELNAYGEFGPNAFNGQSRWLQIGVRTNNNNAMNPWINDRGDIAFGAHVAGEECISLRPGCMESVYFKSGVTGKVESM